MAQAPHLILLGTSHAVAPGAIRDRLAGRVGEIHEFARRVTRGRGLLEETAVLATCGRIEFYGTTRRPARSVRFFDDLAARAPDEIERHHLYLREGQAAVRHLFRVASGLESAVQGEAEILGQVRGVLAASDGSATPGPTLRRLFEAGVATGRRVRSETGIGRGGASLAGAALALLKARSGDLEGRTALILGAGETGRLVAEVLAKAGARIRVANRTLTRAEELAERWPGATVVPFEPIESALTSAEIVVSAVSHRPSLVTPDLVREARRASPGSGPTWFVDLAHPRNVDPAVGDLSGVTVLDLEQVEASVREARSARAVHVPLAEAIVDREVERFWSWLRGRGSVPHLRALREHVLTTARSEADRFGQGLGPDERERLERFARSLARTLLHHPTLTLREIDPGTEQGRQILEWTGRVFGLDTLPDDYLESA